MIDNRSGHNMEVDGFRFHACLVRFSISLIQKHRMLSLFHPFLNLSDSWNGVFKPTKSVAR